MIFTDFLGSILRDFTETFEKHLKVSSVTTKKVSFIFTFFGSAHCDE